MSVWFLFAAHKGTLLPLSSSMPSASIQHLNNLTNVTRNHLKNEALDESCINLYEKMEMKTKRFDVCEAKQPHWSDLNLLQQ